MQTTETLSRTHEAKRSKYHGVSRDNWLTDRSIVRLRRIDQGVFSTGRRGSYGTTRPSRTVLTLGALEEGVILILPCLLVQFGSKSHETLKGSKSLETHRTQATRYNKSQTSETLLDSCSKEQKPSDAPRIGDRSLGRPFWQVIRRHRRA